MGSKHRMPEPPDRIRPPTGRRANVAIGAIAAAVASAGVLAALLVHLGEAGSSGAPQASIPVPAQQDGPLSQQGTIVAVSSDSVTARSVDGFTRTYRITPDTTTITERGNTPAEASPRRLAINDEVEIVGAVQNGIAVATAVADRAMTGLHGPPMHFTGTQPLGNSGPVTISAP